MLAHYMLGAFAGYIYTVTASCPPTGGIVAETAVYTMIANNIFSPGSSYDATNAQEVIQNLIGAIGSNEFEITSTFNSGDVTIQGDTSAADGPNTSQWSSIISEVAFITTNAGCMADEIAFSVLDGTGSKVGSGAVAITP